MQTLSLRCLPTPLRVLRHLRASQRIRFDAPDIRGLRSLATTVERELADLPGVMKAVAGVETGRVLVLYAARSSFLSLLREAKQPSEPAPTPGGSWLPRFQLGGAVTQSSSRLTALPGTRSTRKKCSLSSAAVPQASTRQRLLGGASAGGSGARRL